MTIFVIWVIGVIICQFYVRPIFKENAFFDAILIVFAWPVFLGAQLREDFNELKAARKTEKEVDFHADK